MSLIGFALGSAAIKGLFRIWTGETIFSGIEDGPIDGLVRRVSANKEQRIQERQLDAIAEEIADRIEPFLSKEIGGLDEGERNAAILAAQKSLDLAGVMDPKVIIDLDCSAVDLVKLIRENDPSAITQSVLGSAGAGLYDTLINECAGYIVSIVHRLPGYTSSQATELLVRSSKMLEITKQVLDGLPSSSVPNSWGQGSEHQRFENKYRQSVAEFSSKLHLYGVTSPTAKIPYQLSVAYISLAVDLGHSRGPVRKLNSEKSTEEWPVGREYSGNEESMRIESLLEGSDYLILSGGAGSGKTTLIQWLALTAVNERTTIEAPKSWSSRIPFIIPLRRYISESLPTPEDFVSTISPNLSGAMPSGWVHRILADGRGLLLIDGLDEIPRERRSEAQQWVQGLIRDFPMNKVVVTSRTTAITRGWQQSEDFQMATLQPMDFSDIRSFVKNWHNAAIANAGKTNEAEILKAAKSLLAIVRDTPAIRSLCTTPLLCALICALHLDAGANLPNNRMEVYKTALEMLVIRRDSDRNVYRPNDQELGYREREYLLRSYALWLHENGASDSTRADYFDRVNRDLKVLHKVNDDSSNVSNYLLERSGVLREPIPGRIDFVHRTFLEYLAAAAVIENNSIDRLILVAHEDHWREVIVMAAGHANSEQRSRLLNGLLDSGGKKREYRHRLYMLAVACMETSADIEVELVARLQGALSSVLPPTNMSEAAAVASAGTLAVNLLKFSNQKANVSAASVRALSLIGGESALDVLATYSTDPRVTVTRQLIRSWSGFDTDKYAQKVLSSSPLDNGQNTIKEVEQLASLHHLKNARNVFLELPGALTSPGMLPADNPAIVGLDASWNSWLKSLDDLPAMPRLQSLQLRGTAIENINGIGRYPLLRHVALNDCVKLGDIDRICEIESVEYLDISGTPIRTLEGLDQLTDLRVLRLTGMNELTRIDSPISVRRVFLPYAPKLESIAGLAISPRIELLTLGKLSDKLKKLSLPDSLKDLRLTSLFSSNLHSISGAVNLTSLTIEGYPDEAVLEWASSLASLRHVEWVEFIDRPRGASIDGLIERFFEFSHLERLEVWSNQKLPEFPYLNLSFEGPSAIYTPVI